MMARFFSCLRRAGLLPAGGAGADGAAIRRFCSRLMAISRPSVMVPSWIQKSFHVCRPPCGIWTSIHRALPHACPCWPLPRFLPVDVLVGLSVSGASRKFGAPDSHNRTHLGRLSSPRYRVRIVLLHLLQGLPLVYRHNNAAPSPWATRGVCCFTGRSKRRYFPCRHLLDASRRSPEPCRLEESVRRP